MNVELDKNKVEDILKGYIKLINDLDDTLDLLKKNTSNFVNNSFWVAMEDLKFTDESKDYYVTKLTNIIKQINDSVAAYNELDRELSKISLKNTNSYGNAGVYKRLDYELNDTSLEETKSVDNVDSNKESDKKSSNTSTMDTSPNINEDVHNELDKELNKVSSKNSGYRGWY